jgi:hypothetical protein
MLLLRFLFLFTLFHVEILYLVIFFKVFSLVFFQIFFLFCLLSLVIQFVSFLKQIFFKFFSCYLGLLPLHRREQLKHFEQYRLMLLNLLFSEIKIELKSMAGFVQIKLVNFTFNQFLLHLVSILLLMPFAIKLNFEALLRVGITICFINPYFVVFQIH